MIKLVALDLDGTLFTEDLIIAAPVRAAIREAQELGVYVTLATGRMVRSARPIAADLAIAVPIICYQGSVVYDLQAGVELLHIALPTALALQVIDFVQGKCVSCNAYIDDNLYVAELNPGVEFYASLSNGIQINTVGNLQTFVAAAVHGPTKLSMVLEDEAATDQMLVDIRQEFGASIYAVKSYPLFAEAVNPSANKAVGLARLAEHLGVKQEETMAIGDGMNDIPMLEWAGVGVAMGQSRPDVHAAADYVTSPVTQDGVAVAFRRFVFDVARV